MRAKAALLTMLALPGSAYLYQGEELGLPEVKELPPESRQDPIFLQSEGALPGRDGCRVPLPWSGAAPPYGFSPEGVDPWLPQPDTFASLTAESQAGDSDSPLEFYRRALACRRDLRRSIPYHLEWLDSPEGALFFTRGSLTCAINCGPEPVRLPPHDRVLLSSGPVTGDLLPPDTAVWLHRP